jgi:signal transduction histidine kinase
MLVWFERAWRTYRSSTSARQRVQAKFWLLGAVIQTPFLMTNLLPQYGIHAYPLGNVGNVIFLSIVAYAMVRHRLMDVDFVVRKGVSFCAASAVVLIPGAIAMAALTRATGANEPTVLVCAALALALVAVVVIPTLQEALETQVHRALFPRVYDYRLRLRQLAAVLVHVFDQGELVRRLGDGLLDILDVERCEIYLREHESGRLALAYPHGGEANEGLTENLLTVIESLKEPTLVSELGNIDGIQSLGWEVVVPLGIKQSPNGFVALGANRYLRIFSSEDLEVLATVAADASVALQNVSLSRQLRRSEIVLERANQLSSLGMLAAGIAHEIRNPLVAVKTFLDLLPQRLDDPAFLDHFRELSLSELRRVDLLALGKSKTQERRAVDIAGALEPVVRLMESTARKRQVTLQVRFQTSLPAVWADPDQLKQIILNLLLNAIEVSPTGGTVGLQVRLAGRDGVVLEVRDEGPGIPAEQREAIFHPFFTTKDTGTGLGLALVHQMVVEHGGEITVESEVGMGTMFRVTLPTARVNLARTGT